MSQITRDYPSFMMKDMLYEFRQNNYGEGSNTKALIDALAAQFTDLLEAFNSIEDKTILGDDYPVDDEIGEYAVGKQLDGIGNIVALTRKEASLLSNQICSSSQINPDELKSFSNFSVFGQNGEKLAETLQEYLERAEDMIIPAEVSKGSTSENPYAICDNLYRDYLKHKVFLINSTATYRDVMKNIRMFWREDAKIRYEEWPERPGAIVLSTEEITPEQNARLFFMIPVIKAAGVELLRMATTVHPVSELMYHIAPYLYNVLIQTTLPPIIEPTKHTANLYPYTGKWNVLDTDLKSGYEKNQTTNKCGIYRLYNAVSSYPGAGGKRITVLSVDKPSVSGSVVVPAFLDGVPVTQLSSTFSNCHNLTEVYLPSTVKSIMGGVFSNCENLKYIEMYPVDVIFYSAFLHCDSLETIYWKGTIEEFNNVTYYAPSSGGRTIFENVQIVTFEGEITHD